MTRRSIASRLCRALLLPLLLLLVPPARAEEPTDTVQGSSLSGAPMEGQTPAPDAILATDRAPQSTEASDPDNCLYRWFHYRQRLEGAVKPRPANAP